MPIIPLGGVDMFLVNYIRSYKVRTLKTKFITLYILNVLDIIFTLLYVDAYKFKEGKGLIQTVKYIDFPDFFIKTGITLLLLVILNINMRNTGDKPLFYSNIIIMLSMIFYIFINIGHIISGISSF